MSSSSSSSSRRHRSSGAALATWLGLGVAVPVVAFFNAAYLPNAFSGLGKSVKPVTARAATDTGTKVTVATVAPNGPQTADGGDSVGALPSGSASFDNPQSPLTIETHHDGPVPITMVIGGTAGARRSPIREGVADFVKDAGASAGINGTFFANASLTGTDNLLIGPSLCDNDAKLVASPFDNKPQLADRPMVLISGHHTLIVPYQLGSTDNEISLHSYLPEIKDAFVGGVWLVRDGVAADKDTIGAYNIKDAMDPRRRAFFAIMSDGRPAVGASTDVATSRQLARALQQAGAQEAVLLDSGFSTSLVFQDHILVTGHTSAGIPSRPVPQAVLLYGQPDEASVKLASTLGPTENVMLTASTIPEVHLARRRRRHSVS